METNDQHLLEIKELHDSRCRIDPLADDEATAIMDSKDVQHLQRVLMEMATKDQGIPDELPEAAKQYFTISAQVNFTDEEKARLDRASDIFPPMVQ